MALCPVLQTPSHHENHDRRPLLNTHAHTHPAAPQILVPNTQGKAGSCGLPREQLHASALTPVAPSGQSPTSTPLLSLQEPPTGCAPDPILPPSLLSMRPHLTSQDGAPSVLPSPTSCAPTGQASITASLLRTGERVPLALPYREQGRMAVLNELD